MYGTAATLVCAILRVSWRTIVFKPCIVFPEDYHKIATFEAHSQELQPVFHG